jgi:APA family basic amino acid/polyamine antiporter
VNVRTSALTPPAPIGFWTSVALVMGNMIGSGVFLLPASLAPYRGVSLLGWIISAGGSLALALTFARLARWHPTSGGPYAFTRLAYGDLAGFLVAWGYWISIWTANAALAVAFVGYLDPFIPSIVRTPALAGLLAIGAIWLLTIVNALGIRVAGRVQVVTTALKLLPLIAVGIAGVMVFQPSHFVLAPIDGTGTGDLGRDIMATATLSLWAFVGLESATIPAGDTADAEHTVPRATIVGTVLTTIVYLVATVGVMSLVEPAALKNSSAPFADAGRAIFGNSAAAVIALGAATSCFGALNGWVLVVGQLPRTIALDGLLPPAFARLSSRGTPAFAMVVAACLSTLLVAMNSTRGLVSLFTFFILLSTLSVLVPYTFCSLAGVILHRRNPQIAWPAGATLTGAIAFAFSLFAIGGAGADVVFWGFLLLLSGLGVYAIVGR